MSIVLRSKTSALEIVRGGKPGYKLRLGFPMEAEALFVTEAPGQKEAA